MLWRRWVRLQTLWRFQLKDLSIDEMVGAWCFGCCMAHRGLPVGFLLLRYSVLYTDECLSLLYLLYVPFSTSKLRVRLAPWNRLKPSSKICSLTFPRRYVFCGSFVFLYVFCLSWFRVCLLLPYGHLLGKDWTLGSYLWCLIVFLSLSHVVSWVMCGAWFYQFLIFVAFIYLLCATNKGADQLVYRAI